eukprot:5623155-Amphidinium_carterae.1
MEVTVDGVSAATVGARLQELALWVGKQCEVLAKGEIADCDAVPPPRPRVADRRHDRTGVRRCPRKVPWRAPAWLATFEAEARVRVPDLRVPGRAVPVERVQ